MHVSSCYIFVDDQGLKSACCERDDRHTLPVLYPRRRCCGSLDKGPDFLIPLILLCTYSPLECNAESTANRRCVCLFALCFLAEAGQPVTPVRHAHFEHRVEVPRYIQELESTVAAVSVRVVVRGQSCFYHNDVCSRLFLSSEGANDMYAANQQVRLRVPLLLARYFLCLVAKRLGRSGVAVMHGSDGTVLDFFLRRGAKKLRSSGVLVMPEAIVQCDTLLKCAARVWMD